MFPQDIDTPLVIVYFVYGLAFFSMGLAIFLERGRGSDIRLRLALRPLAAFGVIHGVHEWLEMFEQAGIIAEDGDAGTIWSGIKLILLAFSFLSLSGFGFSLLAPNIRLRRLSLLAPLGLVSIWAIGSLILRGRYPGGPSMWHIIDVWTRYSLAIPAALAASVGLIVQQRAFRQAGMAEFGRDSLVASLAFGWYGLVGQLFGLPSRLPPSTFLNQELFYEWFRFPVQMLRAAVAIVVAVSVIRFLRAFDTEIKRQISALQRSQLEEAQHSEALRRELLRRVVAAQEAERQRIARELHDETGQTLTAIGLGLRGIAASIHTDEKMVVHNLHKLELLASNSLDELQRLIVNLRPSHLDDLGLLAALRWYTGEIKNHTEMEIIFEDQGEEITLLDPIRIAIFRIVQEAITNVIKHADASQIRVFVNYEAKHVQVTVNDDGCGMAVQNLNQGGRPSWGLLGMQERVTLLAGEFSLESAPEEGTVINIRIPYEQEKPNLETLEPEESE
ncbi:MAG: sensor histidine kinase [Chloroflexota bacterium]